MQSHLMWHHRNVMRIICLLFVLQLISGCEFNPNKDKIKLEFEDILLGEPTVAIHRDDLSRVSGIQCNDSSLIVFDRSSESLFFLVNLYNKDQEVRFGTIGQGPGELALPNSGHIQGDVFYVYSHSIGLIVKFHLDSIFDNKMRQPIELARLKFPFESVFISDVAPLLNENYFLGAGLYGGKFQYVVIDTKSRVVDYAVEVYNSKEKDLTISHKQISNCGILRKHPTMDKFVYSVIFSSNIDFIEVIDRKINVIKLQRERDPLLKPITTGTISATPPDENCEWGYIDMAVSDKYVYCLHSKDKVTTHFCSKTIRVFDWDGNPVKQFSIEHDAYGIAVSESQNKLFITTKADDGGWEILCYNMK